jgi:hypothetical protein
MESQKCGIVEEFMGSEFEKSIGNIVNERLEAIRFEFVSNNKRYRRLNMRIKRLQDEIDKATENLPDDIKRLLLLYEDLEAELESSLQKAIYRKGLRDGIQLANIARKVLKL